MSELLSRYDGVVIYMDNILVYGATKAEHNMQLERVLNTLSASGFKLSRKKLKCGQTD